MENRAWLDDVDVSYAGGSERDLDGSVAAR
jgi:hypothetical protein